MIEHVRIIDVETTGLSPAEGAGVVELAWADVVLQPPGEDGARKWAVSGRYDALLIDPVHKIPAAMSAIHHIVDEMVAGAPTLATILGDASASPLVGAPVLAAHKSTFEQGFLDPEKKLTWLCTWKLAIHMAPQAPTHSNQGLRYWLKLRVDPELSMPPHRAGPDAYVTASILARMLAKISVEEAVEISARPALLPYLPFGMHAMKPISQVPDSYFTWILKQDFDEDVKHTAFTTLGERRSNKKMEEKPEAPYY